MRQIETKKEMREFFEDNLRRGQTVEEIYSILVSQGYPKSLINIGYNEAVAELRRRKELREKAEAPKKVIEEIEPIVEEKKKEGFFKRIFGRRKEPFEELE